MIEATSPPGLKRGQARPEMVRRLDAIETVRARFEGKVFAIGRNDCLQLARAMAVAMGHRGLPKVPKYRNLLGAKRALQAQGVQSVEALLNRHFERIPPAAMRIGDIGLVAGTEEDGGETLVVSLGNKLWGWHQDVPELAVIEPHVGVIAAAWRL